MGARMGGWMDGRKDGWVGEWVGGWMGGWVGGCIATTVRYMLEESQVPPTDTVAACGNPYCGMARHSSGSFSQSATHFLFFRA